VAALSHQLREQGQRLDAFPGTTPEPPPPHY
jgi:hypothetical protein